VNNARHHWLRLLRAAFSYIPRIRRRKGGNHYPRAPSRETQVAIAILDRAVVEVQDFDAPGVPEFPRRRFLSPERSAIEAFWRFPCCAKGTPLARSPSPQESPLRDTLLGGRSDSLKVVAHVRLYRGGPALEERARVAALPVGPPLTGVLSLLTITSPPISRSTVQAARNLNPRRRHCLPARSRFCLQEASCGVLAVSTARPARSDRRFAPFSLRRMHTF